MFHNRQNYARLENLTYLQTVVVLLLLVATLVQSLLKVASLVNFLTLPPS